MTRRLWDDAEARDFERSVSARPQEIFIAADRNRDHAERSADALGLTADGQDLPGAFDQRTLLPGEKA